MADIPDLSPETKEQLLGIVGDKTGTKRAARIAAILAGLEPYRPASSAQPEEQQPQPSRHATVKEEPLDSTPPPAAAAPPPPAPIQTSTTTTSSASTTSSSSPANTEEPAGAAAARAAKPKRSRAKKAAAPPPAPKGNLNPFAGEIGDDEEGAQ